MHSRSLTAVTAVALTLLTTALAHAGEPATQLRTQIDRVLAMLRPGAAETPEPERRAAVRRIIDETFDFQEASRQALGRHWAERAPAERERFIQLFSDLIDRAYLRRLDQYDGEQVQVLSDSEEGDQATVRTRVVTRDAAQVPVDYQMRRGADGRWRVWDIRVEGMSLVSNYRAQFQRILAGGSFQEMIKRLEARVSALDR